MPLPWSYCSQSSDFILSLTHISLPSSVLFVLPLLSFPWIYLFGSPSELPPSSCVVLFILLLPTPSCIPLCSVRVVFAPFAMLLWLSLWILSSALLFYVTLLLWLSRCILSSFSLALLCCAQLFQRSPLSLLSLPPLQSLLFSTPCWSCTFVAFALLCLLWILLLPSAQQFPLAWHAMNISSTVRFFTLS